MLALIVFILIIPIVIAIITLGFLMADGCIDIEEIKEFIVWLDERADGRKKNRQGRSKFYDKNSRY